MQQIRIARHVNNLDEMIVFYKKIGFEVIGEFNDHAGYSGVFMSMHDAYHLEFTVSDEKTDSKHNEDDLLVFYCENDEEYSKIRLQFENDIMPKNPYWIDKGFMVTDPIGQNIMICKMKW